MKIHTADFKEAIAKGGRQIHSKILYGLEELESELYSITYSYEGNILKSVMKTLEVETTVDIPINEEIKWLFGVLVDEDYEYLDYGNFIVYKSEFNEDTGYYTLICCDKMLYSMKPYENMNINYPITVRSYISEIADYLGLDFANESDTSFANWNKEIPNEKYLDASGNDIGYTFRDVLDELAQVTASTICINDDDELEIRYITNTLDTITGKHLKDINVKFGEQYGPVNSIVLSRSGEADNVYIQDEQSIEENGLCEIKIIDNQIMNDNNRSDYLPDLLSKLGGLEYYVNDFSSTGICYLELCDRYTIQHGGNSYSCIMMNDEINVTSGLEELIHTELLEESQTDYTKADKTDRKINQTYLIVDKQNQVIESLISNVTEQNSKISQITQTVDELDAKIQDIADITTAGETSYASLQLDEINESEPISVTIRPITNSISYLYPKASGLYPDDTLFMPDRKLRFTNRSTNEVFDYVLPDDLLYYDSTHYDEFYLNYDSQTCQVTKRCAYDADGNVVLLANEVINSYTYPLIQLTDGDYTISIPGYEFGYLSVRLMTSNIYTSQFATKAEVTSEINQTSQQITAQVNAKFTNYSTTTQMNSAIAIKANEITSSVSSTYETKSSAQYNYSQLQQTDQSITSTVATKVGNNEIISKINQSPESVTINANKISLSGKAINLTADGISISSRNFALDTNGNLTAYNVNVTGTVNATGGTFNGSVNIYSGNSLNCYTSSGNRSLKVDNSGVSVYGGAGTYCGALSPMIAGESAYGIGLRSRDGQTGLSVYNEVTQVTSPNGIYAYAFHQVSLEQMKKNISKFSKNALDIVENGEIYNFNYKTEDDTFKRHIGFVIGDKYKTPDEVISTDGNGIDTYSMISILWKAVQEQQEQIEELKKEINKLKGDK